MKVAIDYGCTRITDMFPSFVERIEKRMDAPKRMDLLVCSLSRKDEKSARTFASTLDEFYLATISSELMGKKETESLGLLARVVPEERFCKMLSNMRGESSPLGLSQEESNALASLMESERLAEDRSPLKGKTARAI